MRDTVCHFIHIALDKRKKVGAGEIREEGDGAIVSLSLSLSLSLSRYT